MLAGGDSESDSDFRPIDLDEQSEASLEDVVRGLDENVAEKQGDEVDSWIQLSMEEKWEDVMRILHNREDPCRWDDECGDSSVNNFLEEYKKEGLKIKDEREVRSPTALHLLAKNFDNSGFACLDRPSQQRIINFLLDHQKSESNRQTGHKMKDLEDPILIVALRYDNKDFIHFLLLHCLDCVKDLLHASDEKGTNTLHHIFKDHFPKAIQEHSKNTTPRRRLDLKNTYKLALSFAKAASDKTIAAQDMDGYTPLHYALDYRLCRIPAADTHQKIVFQLIGTADKFLRERAKGQQFNHMEESPYLYFLRTQKEFLETLPKNKAPNVVAQNLQSRSDPTRQKGMSGEGQSRTQVSKAGVESWKEMRPEGPSGKDFVGRGKTNVFPSAQQVGPGHTNQLPKETVAKAKDAGLMDARGLVRRSTFRDQSPVPTRARYPDGMGQSSPVDVVQIFQMPAHPSQPDDMSREQARVMDVTSAKVIQKTRPTSHTADDKESYKQAAEEIRRRLKLHYIRTRSDVDAKDLLYGKVASDKNLYFDATHLKGESSSTMTDLINMLSQPGGFEDTLSYVYLPCHGLPQDKVTDQKSTSNPYIANQGRPRESKTENGLSIGRDSLVTVFDTLAKFGVRNIIHLHVDDMYDNRLYHTDAAIERSICGMDRFFTDARRAEGAIGIETWDWVKPDLSIDVIRFAAPSVVKLNLYWSGIQTVLRGWARKEGIPGLYVDKGKKLTTLVLHASPGIESVERMNRAVIQFQNEIKDNTNGGVDVDVQNWISNKGTGSQADSQLRKDAVGQSQAPPDHDWVKSMENFRRSLSSVHNNMPKEIQPRRIKVALIDDGVRLSDLDTYNKSVQITGLSYWTPIVSSSGTFVGQSWHQSTHGHGTIMANMLVRVNPWVILHVIRIQDHLDNSYNGTGAIKIHAESAANAIRAAIIRDVDIISMSWTVRDVLSGDTGTKATNKYEEQSIEALKQAIEAAKAKRIIMFCSAADEIKAKGADSLPYAQAQGYIFRIGAASPSGQRDMMSEDQQHINWFFPGNQVAEARDPRSKDILKYRSGSSVSTALAAGLASLVMYLPRLMQAYYERGEEKDPDAASKFATYAGKLRARENMRRVFDIMLDPGHEDKKFLSVWGVFDRPASRILESQTHAARGNSKPWSVLDELVTGLCSKLGP